LCSCDFTIMASHVSRIPVLSWAFLRIWFMQEGYIWDWIVAIVLTIINHVVPLTAIRPVDRFYINTDPTLSYPYEENTISSTVLYILAFAFPGVCIVVSASLQKSFHDGHHGLLSLLESFSLACGWKRWMNLTGRLRPNWLALYAMGGDKEKDGHESYPSGHTTYMFCTASVLTLYCLGKLHVLSHAGQAQFARALLCLAPLVLATFVMCTRIADYKHNPSDVNAAAFIGISTGLLSYLINYPSLLDMNCHLPKVRRWTTQGGLAVSREGSSQVDSTGYAMADSDRGSDRNSDRA